MNPAHVGDDERKRLNERIEYLENLLKNAQIPFIINE